MKNPALYSLVLLALTVGCSDDATFTGVAAKVPARIPEAPMVPPGGDAVAEVPSETSTVETETTAPVVSETVEIPEVPTPVATETATIPNAQLVTKVGVNFEDQPGRGDSDFNDAVLCFKGGFEVTPSIIQATKTQTVEAVLFSEAQCTNHIIVKVMRGNQVVSSMTYNPKVTHSTTLQFEKGDRLDVSMVSVDCDPGALSSMTDQSATQLAPDLCNVQ